MSDLHDKAGKPERGPKPRRTGSRETIIAGKKYVLRVFLGRDAAHHVVFGQGFVPYFLRSS